MNIQTDASKITQAELDHIHRMTKIDRVGRINAQARAAKMRNQVRILREALSGVLDSSEDGGDMNDIDWSGIRAALEATKEA